VTAKLWGASVFALVEQHSFSRTIGGSRRFSKGKKQKKWHELMDFELGDGWQDWPGFDVVRPPA